MEQFDLEVWKNQKKKQAQCPYHVYICRYGLMSNGKQIIRFNCMKCNQGSTHTQLTVSDEDRVIPSKKYEGKTLREIVKIDRDYLMWIAKKSKSSQPDRYAVARVLLGEPYTVPYDGEEIPEEKLYARAVERARKFIENEPQDHS